MKYSTSLFLIFISMSTVFAGAEGKSPRQRAEHFLATLTKGETDKAFDQLFVGSPAGVNSAKLDDFKRQTAANLPPYGKSLGDELVIEQSFGVSVVRLVYILKMEKHPVVVEFFFYKPRDIWFLANIRLNDELDGLRDPIDHSEPNHTTIESTRMHLAIQRSVSPTRRSVTRALIYSGSPFGFRAIS